MSFAEILKDLEARGQGKLEKKLPSWSGVDLTVPSSLNLEQSSSEEAALFKASLIPEGGRVADLTGGLGADSWAFARRASAVWYNERDSVLLEAVRHNFAALGVSGVIFNGYDISLSDTEWLKELTVFRPDVIYLDPARRSAAGRKVFLLEDCSPDVVQLLPSLLEAAPQVMVKVSPMADITMLRRRLEGSLKGIIVVGMKGECKELLCICGRNAAFEGVRLHEDGSNFDGSVPASPGDYLFVPSAALVKSALGASLGLPRLGGRTEIYSSTLNPSIAPFGSFYTLLENLQLHKSMFRSVALKYPRAEVRARDIPMSSDELRAALKVRTGSDIHIWGCSIDGSRRLLVLKKVSCPEQVV